MINAVSMDGENLIFHQSDYTSTKAFTHGSLLFTTSTVKVGKFDPVPLPAGFKPVDGTKLKMFLAGPEGEIRERPRVGSTTLLADKKTPGIWRVGGMAQTPRTFREEDGWKSATWSFRIYPRHPGIKTDGKLPQWMIDSKIRQRAFWNRMAYLCREARRACSSMPEDALRTFTEETILPAIDRMNDKYGPKQGKLKMKYPKKLKVDLPTCDSLWKFVGELRGRMEKDRPVPDGLLDQVLEFTKLYPSNYDPINKFNADLESILEYESKHIKLAKEGTNFVQLRAWEARPLFKRFKAVLKSRRTRSHSFTDGWPYIRYPEDSGYENWSIHYYFNEAGVMASDLEDGKTIKSLTLGQPVNPASSGHPMMRCKRRIAKMLRQASLDLLGEDGERWTWNFAILQHRRFPENSHLKQWSIVECDGKLSLCFIVEFKIDVLPEPDKKAAGLDIGWRKIEDKDDGSGLRFGMLYEPTGKTFKELRLNLNKMPCGSQNREPFTIDFGATREERRHPDKLILGWKAGDPLPNAFETRSIMAAHISKLKDGVKKQLVELLGDKTPPWIDKASRLGLRKMLADPETDPQAKALLTQWEEKDSEFGAIYSNYCAKIRRRMDDEHHLIAYDICEYLKKKHIFTLHVETSFLSDVAGVKDNFASEALKKSQKYRQFLGVAKFVSTLKWVAEKQGIVVVEVNAARSSRLCHHCNTLNVGGEAKVFVCSGCARQIDQDQNAAINIARTAPKSLFPRSGFSDR